MAKPLDTYRSKRDFTRSREPSGREGRRKNKPRFVVQKHDARRLHYDLRLEIDGVLKSWAVTRGPSLVPSDKRLAVMTEDHPVEYLAWEGAIPKGQYGGGTMIVWDHGTWRPEGDVVAGLAKGHLEFALDGERLKGHWHLVRMKGRGKEKKEPWLLIKSEDDFARAPGEADILDEFETSVLSKRTNAQIGDDVRPDHAARSKVAKRRSPKPSASAKPSAGAKPSSAGRKAILPPFVPPSLATTAESAPRGKGWLFEIKLDGYRMQARIDGGTVKLSSRAGLDWTAKFKPIAKAMKALALPAALIDGEIVVEDAGGVSSFSALQQALKDGATGAAIFYAFDLLYLDGRDLRGLPLIERKGLLQQALDEAPGGAPLRLSEHIDEDGDAMARHACRFGLEGIIAKKADAPYRSGRSELWRKVKCSKSQDFVIAGYMPSTTARRAIGSLILGVYEKGELVHVGRVGTGFTNDVASDLWRELEPLRRPKPAFAVELPALARRHAVWVAPERVCEVMFRAWTGDGHLRHAAFKTMRPDVGAKDITREGSVKPTRARRAPNVAGEVALTHPDRVLWDDIGLTKQGLYEFYTEIADRILPYLVGRPLSLLRCPDGLGSCFFQKHAWAGMDKRHLHASKAGADETIVLRDLGGLLALVQSSVLEIHPWGATIDKPELPDHLTFDLDPGEGLAWGDMVSAALETRERLQALGLIPFVKTTGGKGLHVVVPLKPQASWTEAKSFAKDLADAMAADDPKRFVATSTKRLRKDRIYVDYLRNQRGATAVAAYSTRARPGAPVSVPVAWDELAALGSGARYSVQNLPTRLDALSRDPWADFAKSAKPLAVPAKAPRRR